MLFTRAPPFASSPMISLGMITIAFPANAPSGLAKSPRTRPGDDDRDYCRESFSYTEKKIPYIRFASDIHDSPLDKEKNMAMPRQL